MTGGESDGNTILSEYGIDAKAPEDMLSRGEFALIVDGILNPFNACDVDIRGNFIERK